MNISIYKKNAGGFTLIEVILSASIVAMLIFTAFSVLFFGQNSFFALGKQNEIQTLAYQISSTISAQVRKSAKIVELQSSYLSIDDKNGNTITFLLDPLEGTLLQLEESGNSKTLAKGVKSLNFTAKGNKGVQMTFELEQKDQNFRFTTTIYRRY